MRGFIPMRVLEHGLRWLADAVGLPKEQVAHENWKNVIDQIERRIRSVETATQVIRINWKGCAFTVVQLCNSDTSRMRGAITCPNARAHYDSRKAAAIWNHVKEFMQHLALVQR